MRLVGKLRRPWSHAPPQRMSTHVLIVEGDAALSGRMRGALEARGFSVQETTDGRTCVEVARQGQAACVVLAVDLPAGQNGYILCGKFKKDDELRLVPVAIVGSSEGFAQHGKLKNRADAYLAKPLHLDEFAERIIELTGHTAVAPSPPSPRTSAPSAFDFEEATVSGDPDLDLIDAAFDTSPLAPRASVREPELPTPPVDSEFAGRATDYGSTDAQGDREAPEAPLEQSMEESQDLTFTPVSAIIERQEQPAELEPLEQEATAPADDASQQREVSRLQAALEDAQARSFSSDVRIHQLEAELAGRAALADEEPNADARPSRDQVLRRDRDILRLKADLHAREQEVTDLREQAMRLEQQNLELTGEVSRRDGQIKSLQTRTEQDRRRVEQTVERAEAATREAHDQAADLQAAIAAASARADAAEQEANDLRARADAAEDARDHAEGELTAARRDRELNRAHADGAQRQLASLQSALEQTQSDLAAAREELGHRDAARDDELGAAQQRCRDLEMVARKHEERVARLYVRLKSEERAREKAARAVAMASQLLSQSGPGAPAPDSTPGGDDEPAAA
jgi:DNA-binding response OmpR family regulator